MNDGSYFQCSDCDGVTVIVLKSDSSTMSMKEALETAKRMIEVGLNE